MKKILLSILFVFAISFNANAVYIGGGAGSGGAVEGTAILSTGEAGGTKFLREDGDGTCSWQTPAGGGDALTTNPLSQFAATTSAQLRGVLSDESGTGVFMTSNGDGSSLTGLQFDQFITQTAWRVFYSNGDGDVTELALGADGTYLKSNGASAAPTFETPAGGGDVTGPASSIAESIPVFSDTGGKTLKDAGLTPTADNLIGWNSVGTLLENKSSLNLAFSGATPEVLFRDTDAAGADPADEDAGSIKANMSTTTEDAEVSDMFLTAFGAATAGTEYTWSWFDSSDAALYLGVMTDSTTPADVAGLEKLKIDFNGTTDGWIYWSIPDSGVGHDFDDENLHTTGVIKGRLEIGADITGSTSHDTTELHNTLYMASAAATITLDAAADAGFGSVATYWVRDAAEALVLDPQAGEKIRIDGTALAAGTAVTGTGADSIITIVAVTDTDGSGTDGYLVTSHVNFASE